MGKAYNSKWKVTPLTVNFNQKQLSIFDLEVMSRGN